MSRRVYIPIHVSMFLKDVHDVDVVYAARRYWLFSGWNPCISFGYSTIDFIMKTAIKLNLWTLSWRGVLINWFYVGAVDDNQN